MNYGRGRRGDGEGVRGREIAGPEKRAFRSTMQSTHFDTIRLLETITDSVCNPYVYLLHVTKPLRCYLISLDGLPVNTLA